MKKLKHIRIYENFDNNGTLILKSPLHVQVDYEGFLDKNSYLSVSEIMNKFKDIGIYEDFRYTYNDFKNSEITEDEFLNTVYDDLKNMSIKTLLNFSEVDVNEVKEKIINDFNNSKLEKYYEKSKLTSINAIDITEDGYLLVKVKSDEDMDTDDIIDYLEGQYSDGWGEGFEQNPIKLKSGLDVFIYAYDSDPDWKIEIVN